MHSNLTCAISENFYLKKMRNALKLELIIFAYLIYFIYSSKCIRII